MTRYILPALPYDYGALEPHILGAIVELHHDKHHRTYVEHANVAIERLVEARHSGELGAIAELERALAFNVSGHVLHSLMWQNLSPGGGDEPSGKLAEQLARDFGSFDTFKRQLVEAAATIMGSGWAALVWEPVSRRLGTVQIHDHQSETTQAALPLMVIDAWEHAYYLQYKTDKQRYFEALWQLWNWDDIAKRLERVRDIDLALPNTTDDRKAA